MLSPCSEHLPEWLAAKADDGLSAEETAELADYLKSHPEAQAAAENAAATHRLIVDAFEKAKPDAELEWRVLQHFLQSISKQPQDFLLRRKEPDSFWRRVLAIAVPSVLMLFLGMALSSLVIQEERPVWKRPGAAGKEGMELGLPTAEGEKPPEAALPSDPALRIDELLRRRKQFRDVELKMEVASWDAAEQAIDQAVRAVHGETEAFKADRQPSGRTKAEIVARVPRKELKVLSDALSGVGEVRSRREETAETKFAEADARLKYLQDAEGRLKDVAAEAKNDAGAAAGLELDLADLRQEMERVRLATAEWTALRETAAVALTIQEADPNEPAYRVDETTQMTLLTPHVRQTFEAIKTLAASRILEARLVQDAEGKESALVDLIELSGRAGALIEEIARLGRIRDLDRKNTRLAVNAGSALAGGRTETGPIRMRIRIQLDDRIEKNLMLQLFTDHVEAAVEKIKQEVAAAGGVVLSAAVSDAGTPGASAQLRVRLYSDSETATIERIRKLGYRSVLDITRDVSNPGAVYPMAVEIHIRSSETPVRQTTLQMETNDPSAAVRQIAETARSVSFHVRRSSFEAANGASKGTVILRGPDSGAPQMLEKLQSLGNVSQIAARGQQAEGGNAMAEFEVKVVPAKLEKPTETFGSAFSRNLQNGFRSFGGIMKTLALAAAYALPWALLVCGVLWVIRRWLRRPG